MTLKNIAKSAVALLLGLTFALGCKGSTKTYTIPTVKNEITKSINVAIHYRRKGELIKASNEIKKTSKKILKTYPHTTLRFKEVKRFLKAAIKIGNLCLDKGQELQQEAVSNRMWKLADVYKARHKKHQELNRKIRHLLPQIQKTEVSASTKAANAAISGGASPRPTATTGDATSAGPTAPRNTEGAVTPPTEETKGDDIPPKEDDIPPKDDDVPPVEKPGK